MSNNLLTKKEAAQMLKVKPCSIDSYRKKGMLKSLSAGPGTRSIRFEAEEVKRLFTPQQN
jgi:predicted site-specific integrase-resolvase